MSNTNLMVITGNVTRDPILRKTQKGGSVTNVSIASNHDTFDETTQTWNHVSTLYVTCTVWGQMAQNVVAKLHKGSNVIAYGEVTARPYTTKKGDKGIEWIMNVQEIGMSLRFGNKDNSTPTKNNPAFDNAPQFTDEVMAESSNEEPPF